MAQVGRSVGVHVQPTAVRAETVHVQPTAVHVQPTAVRAETVHVLRCPLQVSQRSGSSGLQAGGLSARPQHFCRSNVGKLLNV